MSDDWFEEVWRYRDQELYPRLTQRPSDGRVIPIPYAAFSQLGVHRVDPRWLHCGLLSFGPTPERQGFAFLTSGLSNAWDDDRPDPTAISGLGIELRLDNPVDAHWVKDVMLRLSALQLLTGAGQIPEGRLLEDGDQIILGAKTFGEATAMTGLLATATGDLQLPSGIFQILQMFAITDSERQFAAQKDAAALVSLLRERTTYPMNDIHRKSVV